MPCPTPLQQIPGTNFNTVEVPAGPQPEYLGYTNYTDKLLYEIWQTLLILAGAANPPALTKIISFTIGDGQAGTPADGDTSLITAAIQGQSLFNMNLAVEREGIFLQYSSGVTALQIIRKNVMGGTGGFEFDPASGLSFVTGESYNIFVVGQNTTLE